MRHTPGLGERRADRWDPGVAGMLYVGHRQARDDSSNAPLGSYPHTPLNPARVCCHSAPASLPQWCRAERKEPAVNARRDPVEDWVVQQYREIFGDCDTARAGTQVDSAARPGAHRPVHPHLTDRWGRRRRGGVRATAAAGRRRQRDRDRRPSPSCTATSGPLLAGAAALCALDVSRYRAHKSTRMLESVVRQTTGHRRRKVIVSLAPRRRTVCRAAITLHPGTVIRPKAFSRADPGNRGGIRWPRQVGGPRRA